MLVRSNRRTEEEILVCLSLKQEERLKFRKGGWVGGDKGKERFRGSLAGDKECKGESSTNGGIPDSLK